MGQQQAADDRVQRDADPAGAGPDADGPLTFGGSRNMSVMIARVDGIIMAPPMPILARAGAAAG
jgi:hypothetical protein